MKVLMDRDSIKQSLLPMYQIGPFTKGETTKAFIDTSEKSMQFMAKSLNQQAFERKRVYNINR